MEITLLDILDYPDMHGASVLAGWEGIGNKIKGITILEIPLFSKCALPGDLVLSTGYFLKDNLDVFLDFIKKLAAEKISGFAIPPGSYIGVIPNEIIELCQSLNFPLISLPDDIRYWDIATTVLAVQERNRKNKPITANILNIVNSGLSLPSIINMLSLKFSATVLVENRQEEIIAYAVNQDFPLESCRNMFFKINQDALANEYQCEINEDLCKITFEINYRDNLEGYLVFFGYKQHLLKNLDDLIRAKALISSGYYFLSNTVETLQLKKQYAFADILFNKNIFTVNDYVLINKCFEREGRILAISFAAEVSNSLIRKAAKSIEIRCQSDDPYSLVTFLENMLVVLFHETKTSSGRFITLIQDLRKILNQNLSNIDLTIGGGNIAGSLEQYRDSFLQAKQACEFGMIAEQYNQYIDYVGLGLLQMVENTESFNFFKGIGEKRLAKILLLEENQRNDLLSTLITYFENNCQISNTAKKLFIHENTLRYRLQKIEELINLKLDLWENKVLIYFLLKILMLKKL